MPIYGFNRDRAGKLRRIADREGLKPRDKSENGYPADNASVCVWLGKALVDIDLETSGTVRLYVGVPGSETYSGEDFESCFNRTRTIVGINGGDEADAEWVEVVRINGYLYVIPLGCV